MLRTQHSLKNRLLVWVFIPTLLVSVGDIYNTYQQSKEVALLVQDRLLKASAKVISESLKGTDSNYELIIPPAAIEMFENNYRDRVFFSVTNGNYLLGGIEDLHPDQAVAPGTEVFFFSKVHDEEVRAISLSYKIPSSNNDYIVTTVARTTRSYNAFRSDIFWITIRAHSILLLLIVVSLGLAFNWTIRPINKLASILESRESHSLEPLEVNNLPRELGPIVNSINNYISRLNKNLHSYEQFLANTAHHLRTSYAVLKAEIDIELRKNNNDDEKISLLNRLQNQISNGIKIVNNLLLLAQIEKAKDDGSTQHIQKINLSELITTIIERLAPIAYQKGISIEVVDLDTSIFIESKAILIEEAISNLIDNSIHHIPKDGEIKVSLLNEHNHYLVRISDDGPGIPESELENVFKRFYRIDHSKSNSSGLGLSIVKEICQLVGAKIKLSKPHNHSGLQVDLFFNK